MSKNNTLAKIKILIPAIRNVMPSAIAQQIVGVQPMGRAAAYRFVPCEDTGGYIIVDVQPHVQEWIEECSSDMWRSVNRKSSMYPYEGRYLITEELYTLLVMKFT